MMCPITGWNYGIRQFVFISACDRTLPMATSTVVDQAGRDRTVSEVVVRRVADREGCDPVSLEPLYHVVDPEALDALVETTRHGLDRSPTRVSFTYCGYEVVIERDGTVRVSKPDLETPRH